ncbi:MAG: hypothetical protein GVY15_12665 [Bacteroidetes bacterium]|jgi:hypothetical protein|nr:hypothetical protein [Bacteroidota bacterium]
MALLSRSLLSLALVGLMSLLFTGCDVIDSDDEGLSAGTFAYTNPDGQEITGEALYDLVDGSAVGVEDVPVNFFVIALLPNTDGADLAGEGALLVRAAPLGAPGPGNYSIGDAAPLLVDIDPDNPPSFDELQSFFSLYAQATGGTPGAPEGTAAISRSGTVTLDAFGETAAGSFDFTAEPIDPATGELSGTTVQLQGQFNARAGDIVEAIEDVLGGFPELPNGE